MPSEIAEKVFEPLSTTKPAGEGIGLGPSLGYDTVVKQHRGKIDVRSHEGEYTEFIVTLLRNVDHKNGGVG